MFYSHAALPGTDPAPLRGEHQVAIPAREQGPSREGGTASQQPGINMTHPLSSPPKKVYWPEFPALQHEFSSIVSILSEVVHELEPAKFESLIVYLRERLRPMVDGIFPLKGPPNLPWGPLTPSKLFQHLQNCHYWDYLNIGLLEDIIRQVTMADSSLRTQMEQYKNNVCSKVTHTLEKCRAKSVKLKPPPDYTPVAVKVNHSGIPLSFPLHQILQLKDLLVTKFGVGDALFAGFDEGCIVLYFFIPEEAAYSLCPKLESNCTALQDLHVTTVVVFDHLLVDISFQQMTLLNKVGDDTYVVSHCLACNLCNFIHNEYR